MAERKKPVVIIITDPNVNGVHTASAGLYRSWCKSWVIAGLLHSA